MALPDPTEARFPQIPEDAGHYESFYLKASHPSDPAAVWIRYTVHKRPGGRPHGSLWVTLFDRRATGPVACKATIPEPATGIGAWIRIGESRFGDGEAVGEARADGCDATWELRFATDEGPLYHLPRELMYRTPVPRTKLLSPAPAARFDGRVCVAGREVAVEGWPGMVGHNWGSQHAERWIWLHGLGFHNGEETWLDVAIGRVKLGPLTTPWVANGVLCVEGERLPLGGLGRRVEVSERPDGCEFRLAGKGVSVQGEVGAERKDFVGWVYADPDGPEHHVVNCSAADMRLTVERGSGEPVELRVDGGAAYELGMRERDHGMAIQPYPDG